MSKKNRAPLSKELTIRSSSIGLFIAYKVKKKRSPGLSGPVEGLVKNSNLHCP